MPSISEQRSNPSTRFDDITRPYETARIRKETISQVYRLITLAPIPFFPDAIILLCIPLVIVLYMIAGYYVLLAPGSLYNALVSENWEQFLSVITRYFLLATTVLFLRVLRNFLRESAANQLRHRLSRRLHQLYFSSSSSAAALNNELTAPSFYKVLRPTSTVDNPDQRIVADAREFTISLFEVVFGDSGGVFEAVISIVFYSFATYGRTGWFGVVAGWTWSLGAAIFSMIVVNYASPVLYIQEKLEATLRYAHARIRRHAEEIAFLNASQWERLAMDNHLQCAVNNQWIVIQRHACLNLLQNGFSYYVSILMYISLAVAVRAKVFHNDQHLDNAFPVNGTPGEKAQWIAQAGGVFLQLLFAFTMLIQLATSISAFVATVERLYVLADTLVDMSAVHQDEDDGRGGRRRRRTEDGNNNNTDDTHPLITTTTATASTVSSSSPDANDDERVVIVFGNENSDGNNVRQIELQSHPFSPSPNPLRSSSTATQIQHRVLTTIELKSVWLSLPAHDTRTTSASADDSKPKIIGAVSLHLTRGQVIHLRGVTGSGKTSILRVIRGLSFANSGQVEITNERETNIMFIPQGTYVPGDAKTLRELIIYPKTCTMSQNEKDEVLNTLEKIGWTNDEVRMIDEQREWGKILSPGEIQLVAITRVLYANPDIAVLDEATAALDEQAERRVIQALRDTGMGLLFVGHSRALEQMTDVEIVEL